MAELNAFHGARIRLCDSPAEHYSRRLRRSNSALGDKELYISSVIVRGQAIYFCHYGIL
jgi:hypothetical protein